MLLKRRVPRIENRSVSTNENFAHLDRRWIALLRWLQANRVEFVLVGPVGEAIRGNTAANGPVAIAPSPYRRNYERLARALWSAHARLRIDVQDSGKAGADTTPVKVSAERLARGHRWTLRCGVHDLDVEARPQGVPSYQELLYEAGRFQLADDLAIDVASPEDIEHYAHVRRTGTAPEIRITRNAAVPQQT